MKLANDIMLGGTDTTSAVVVLTDNKPWSEVTAAPPTYTDGSTMNTYCTTNIVPSFTKSHSSTPNKTPASLALSME
jgi:hypothetical protein